MISDVTFTAGGGRHVMKLGTRACRAIERATGTSFPKLIASMGDAEDPNISIDLIVTFFAAGLNGGKGCDDAFAEDVIDLLGGFAGAMSILNEAIVAALPAPDGETGEAKSGGNGKPKAA